MAVESARAEVRARGIPVRGGLVALGFAAGSILLGLAIGPVSVGAGPIAESALSHLPLAIRN